jgi:hypothetical protein
MIFLYAGERDNRAFIGVCPHKKITCGTFRISRAFIVNLPLQQSHTYAIENYSMIG